MAQPRPTLAQIAAHAGVSVMSVSRALRRQPGVSADAGAHIRRLAERMGYRPDPLVQALMARVRTRRVPAGSRVIALVLPQGDDPAWGQQEWIRRAIQGASERAQHMGFRLEIFRWQSTQTSDQRLDQILKARGIRGLVMGPLRRPGTEFFFDWSHYAAAAIGASMPRPKLHRVRHHAFKSIQIAIEKLRECGCTRVGLAQSDFSAARVEDMWQAGYLVATDDYADKKRRELYHQTADLEPRTFLAWLRKAQPDGLLMQDNRCFSWMREAGIRIPEQITVAHLNRARTDKDIAGVDQDFEIIGAAAIDLVAEQLLLGEFGIPSKPKDVLLDGVWVGSARRAEGRRVK